jgi:general secretion pathway protein C
MRKKLGRIVLILLLIAATLASAAYWISRLRALTKTDNAATGQLATPSEVNLHAVEALFGVQPTALHSAGSLRITGVVIAPDPKDSIAIVIESGRPARALRTGAEIGQGLHLAEVHRRYVMVSDGTQQSRIEIPERGGTNPATNTTANTAGMDAVPDAARAPRDEPPHRTGEGDDATDTK